MTNEEFNALVQGDVDGLMAQGRVDALAARIRAADRGKVNIRFVYPPIPLRQFDWCATFDNDEPDDDGNMLAGYGKTEAEALDELLTAFEDRL